MSLNWRTLNGFFIQCLLTFSVYSISHFSCSRIWFSMTYNKKLRNRDIESECGRWGNSWWTCILSGIYLFLWEESRLYAVKWPVFMCLQKAGKCTFYGADEVGQSGNQHSRKAKHPFLWLRRGKENMSTGEGTTSNLTGQRKKSEAFKARQRDSCIKYLSWKVLGKNYLIIIFLDPITCTDLPSWSHHDWDRANANAS